jgi:LCP family protein required for cell wall assembly
MNMNRWVCMILVVLLAFAGIAAFAEDAAPTEEPIDEELQQIIDMFAEEEEQIDPSERIEVSAADLSVTPGLDEGWLNILLLGTDDRGNSMNARTDSIIVVSIHQDTAQVKMTSLMRDILVDIPGKGSAKLNAANVYGGPNLAMKTINEKFGLNITNYVMINMNGLSGIIDSVDGIDLAITQGERKWINHYLKEYRKLYGTGNGTQDLADWGDNVHLTGAQATAYCRIRYIGNDQQRTERQRIVLMKLAGKVKQASVWTLATLVPEFFNLVNTNYSLIDVIRLSTLAVKADLDAIQQARIPFDGMYSSGTTDGVWSMRLDFEQNKQQLHDFIYAS